MRWGSGILKTSCPPSTDYLKRHFQKRLTTIVAVPVDVFIAAMPNRRRTRMDSILNSMPSRHVRCGLTKLKRTWFAMQISQRGHYSIERMLALDEYTRTMPLSRVLLVCFGTPLPVILLVLATELLPLQNPSEGWRANYGIWIRTSVQAGVISIVAAGQASVMFDGIRFSTRQLVLLFVSVSVSYTGAAILLAACVGFPIPFMAASMSPIFVMVVSTALCAVAGKRAIHEILLQRRQMFGFVSFLSAQMVVLFVYPFYQVLFNAATDTKYELFVFLLLPLIKIALKNLVSLSIAHMEDMVPEGVMLTVNFFNAMYLATCMRSASSTAIVAVIVAVGILQTGIASRDLLHRAESILSRLQELPATTSPCSIFDGTIALCRNPSIFHLQNRTRIRVHSCFLYQLSSSNQALLSSLQQLPDCRPGRRSLLAASVVRISFLHLPPAISRFPEKLRTLYSSAISVVPEPSDLAGVGPLHSVLDDSLRLLFTTECLMLAVYLELSIPVLYAIFMVAMVQLPNAQYHSELLGVDRHNVGAKVQIIFVYAAIEVVSLVVITCVLKQKARARVLHQLAFVLQSQSSLVHGKLVLWMLMAMGFRIAHFGADFNFRFGWLHKT